ncbi:MAG: sortase [Pseudonocardia sp.]|nr:sortase [Pseudonocardia sp.]
MIAVARGPQAPDLPPVPVRPVRLLEQARPVGLSVPAIGVDTGPLTALHVDAGGVLKPPSEAATAGWSTLGPTPGAQGPAVVVGHVSLDGVAGVFARLAQLAPGDEVGVHRDDGTEAVFTVYRTGRFARAAFPVDEVYGETAGPELRLITTGGVFARHPGEHADNLVVFARLRGAR